MGRRRAPHIGSALAKIAPGSGPMFPFILVPRRLDAGAAGAPVSGVVRWAASTTRCRPAATRIATISGSRTYRSWRMRPGRSCNAGSGWSTNSMSRRVISRRAPRPWALKQSQEKALDVIGSEAIRRAVDLSTADSGLRGAVRPEPLRAVGPAGTPAPRRGARLVQVNWLRTQGAKGYAWDSHRENFEALRKDLIPPFDQAFAGLISDLESSGRLDETLVVVATEFGRTPKVTLSTGGREHWPNAFSVSLAGAVSGVVRFTEHPTGSGPTRPRVRSPPATSWPPLSLPWRGPALGDSTTSSTAR